MFSWEKDRRKKYQLFIDGEGNGEGAGGVITEEGSQEAQHQEGQREGGGQRTQTVPYDRFSQVNREKQELAKTLEQYKKYGSVQDIERAIQRAKDSGKFTQAEKEALDADLLAGSKSHKENTEFIKELRERDERAVRTFREERAPAKVANLIKSLGIQWRNDEERLDKEDHAQTLIARQIQKSQAFMNRWLDKDLSVVEDAWKLVKPYFDQLRRAQNADIQAKKLQQISRPGASGAVNKDGKPADGLPRTPEGRIDERAVLAAASERGFARLKASEE